MRHRKTFELLLAVVAALPCAARAAGANNGSGGGILQQMAKAVNSIDDKDRTNINTDGLIADYNNSMTAVNQLPPPVAVTAQLDCTGEVDQAGCKQGLPNYQAAYQQFTTAATNANTSLQGTKAVQSDLQALMGRLLSDVSSLQGVIQANKDYDQLKTTYADVWKDVNGQDPTAPTGPATSQTKGQGQQGMDNDSGTADQAVTKAGNSLKAYGQAKKAAQADPNNATLQQQMQSALQTAQTDLQTALTAVNKSRQTAMDEVNSLYTQANGDVAKITGNASGAAAASVTTPH